MKYLCIVQFWNYMYNIPVCFFDFSVKIIIQPELAVDGSLLDTADVDVTSVEDM